MTNVKTGRWLLVVLAIVGLALALPVVSAHGNETTADDAPTTNGTADEWATWMTAQMAEHMGPGAVEWMESNMGVTLAEMAQDRPYDNYNGRMYGQGHC